MSKFLTLLVVYGLSAVVYGYIGHETVAFAHHIVAEQDAYYAHLQRMSHGFGLGQ